VCGNSNFEYVGGKQRFLLGACAHLSSSQNILASFFVVLLPTFSTFSFTPLIKNLNYEDAYII
jgi:hypothetical protein